MACLDVWYKTVPYHWRHSQKGCGRNLFDVSKSGSAVGGFGSVRRSQGLSAAVLPAYPSPFPFPTISAEEVGSMFAETIT
eukprot:scaffold13691_cov156-Amphora_coffeaeformis.AAC.3